MNNYMKLEIAARGENEGFARSAVAAFALCLNPSLSELSDIKTAVSEAITNCVVHAYADNIGDIDIFVEIIDSNVHIRITDFGKGIADINKATTQYFSTDESGESAGIGFTVMQSFMDEMTVANNKDCKGITVTMRKNLLKED